MQSRWSIVAIVSTLLATGCAITIQPQITANGVQSVWLDSAGKVWTWGDSSLKPQPVENVPAIVAVAIGGKQTFAIANDGTVWVWGETAPVQVTDLENITAIAAGDGYGMALAEDGIVWVWGINTTGQLGLGDTDYRPFPEPVPNVTDAVAIAAGQAQAFIIRRDGTVLAAGRNDQGQLGDGTTDNRSNFVPVQQLTAVVKITAGENFSLALTDDGQLWAWGDNDFGQLGNGTLVGSLVPTAVQVASAVQFTDIATGSNHALALQTGGTVWTWGYNQAGQLGDGTTAPVWPLPRPVSAVQSIQSIAAGDNHSLALGSDGIVWAWGENFFGQPSTITLN